MLRTYALILGIGFALWGIAMLLGMWVQSPGRIVLVLGTAIIFLYAGFGRVNAKDLRTIVGGIGILYLISAGLLIVVWSWFNTSDDPQMSKILIRGTIGIANLLCAKFLPQRDERRDDHSSKVQSYTTEETASSGAQVTRARSLPKEDHN